MQPECQGFSGESGKSRKTPYHRFNASLEALSRVGIKLDSGLAFKIQCVMVSFSAGC